MQVGSKGLKVSLPLRERVSIARVLVRNTPIVVVDAPCSAQEGYMVSQISNTIKSLEYVVNPHARVRHPARLFRRDPVTPQSLEHAPNRKASHQVDFAHTVSSLCVLQVPDRERKPTSVIAFTQNLSFVNNYEKICLMSDGTFIEKGSHAELMAKKGMLWLLVNNQASHPFVASHPPPNRVVSLSSCTHPSG